MPIRVILRRRFSTRLNVLPGVPVYLQKCDRDLQLGGAAFESSLKILAEESPLWRRRMPVFFKSISIADTVELTTYFSADKCCYINTWDLAKHVQNPAVAPRLLAGSLVFSISTAMLLEGRHGYVGFRYHKYLSTKAKIRFLQKRVVAKNDFDTMAMIKVLNEHLEECGYKKVKSAGQ